MTITPTLPGHSKRPRTTVSLLLVLLVLSTACQTTSPATSASTTPASATASDQLATVMAAAWQSKLSNDPLEANYSGSNDYNHRLKDASPAARAQHEQQSKAYIRQLQAIDRGQLSADERINLDILRRDLQNEVDKYRFNAHHMLIKSDSGFYTRVAFIPNSMPFNTHQDYLNYIRRLETIELFFAQNIEAMKQGLKSGRSQPQAILREFNQSIENFIVDDPRQSLYYQPFTRPLAEGIDAQQYHQLQQTAAAVIKTRVIPAYQRFYDFMRQSYIPGTRKTLGLSETPDGLAYYNNRVKYYTTLDKTAEQVHQIGLQEVARIQTEMMAVINSLAFDGSFADFIHFLRSDQQFYATSADALIKEAAYIAKRMDAKLPALFKHLPRKPYGVAAVPPHLEAKYTTGRYIHPAQDDQPGYYWVNTYGLDRRPLYVLEALTLHEAVPGHHLQQSLAREMENIPPHRRYADISAFDEGWGLYSEFLGIEAGFYQDPYSNFGRLTYEMWRACRLVVDTGIHIKGWSRQQAIDYLQSHTALSLHNVKTEIDRYIAWPAQALSYKMGELTIKRLRHETQNALGKRFDLREFHHQVLKNGSLPLKVLEAQIAAYITAALAM